MSSGPQLESLADVEVLVCARLGQARMPLNSVLSLTEGAVVPLDCAPDAPAILLVNGVGVASGDLVLMDDGMLAVEIHEVSK